MGNEREMEAVFQRLSAIITDEACDRWAQESGLVQRKREITGRGLLMTFLEVVGCGKEVSCQRLSAAGTRWGIEVSAQAWHKKCQQEAAAIFLKQVLDRVVAHTLVTSLGMREMLAGFSAVLIRDSSWVEEDGEVQVKLQVRWDPAHGTLEGPLIQEPNEHDRRTPFTAEAEPPGALVLEDRGFLQLAELAQRNKRGVYFVVPYKRGIALFTPDGAPFALREALEALEAENQEVGEWSLHVGAQERVPVRCVAVRLHGKARQRRYEQIREYARKKQVPFNREEARFWSSWLIVWTNLPADAYPLELIIALARLRWQIEILFRAWKSALHLKCLPEGKPAYRRCVFYARLIWTVLTHAFLGLVWSLFSHLPIEEGLRQIGVFLHEALWRWYHGFTEELALLWQQCLAALQLAHRRYRNQGRGTWCRLQALYPR